MRDQLIDHFGIDSDGNSASRCTCARSTGEKPCGSIVSRSQPLPLT